MQSRTVLVLNASTSPTLNKALMGHGLRSVLMNLQAPKVRIETLEGREHMVVPMVMITKGVHNGSGGPLFYPEAELAKTPEVWNHKPVVVYHPQINGQGVSACDPDIINGRKVGVIMNTTWDGTRLKAEAWLEKSRCEKVDNRILEAIEKKQMMEVSTGLFTDNESADGEWNGEKYTAVAKNYRPDHLAILPDQKGSCSIADGAGLLRNTEHTHEHRRTLLHKALKKKTGRFTYPEDATNDRVIYSNEDGDLVHEGYDINGTGTEATLRGDPEKITRKMQYVNASGKVVANVEDYKPKGVVQPNPADPCEEAPYEDPVDEAAEETNFDFAQKAKQITKVADNITKTSQGQARFGRQAGVTNKKGQVMNKAQMIAFLIANSLGFFGEKDKTFLESKDEAGLKGIVETYQQNKELRVGSDEAAEEEGAKTGIGKGKPKAAKKKISEEEGVTTQAASNLPVSDDDEDDKKVEKKPTKNQTAQEYIDNASPEIRDMLSSGLKAHEAQKQVHIKTITANARNRFSAKSLAEKSLEELQALAELATPIENARPRVTPLANFAGMAEVSSTTQNAEAPLDLPKFDFTSK